MRKTLILLAVSACLFLFGISPSYAFETLWHGQFRINSYYQNADNNDIFIGVDRDRQASRLRWRPSMDVKFESGVLMHMQLNIGHINSNISNARFTLNGGTGNEPAFGLRHAYISTPLPPVEGWTLTAGLVPMSDKFGDTLFSGDWDYNPLTYMLTGKAAGMDIRIAHGNLNEGTVEGGGPADDIDQWFFDADMKNGFGASFYALNDNSKPGSLITGASQTVEDYLGVRYAGVSDRISYNAFFIYNWGKRKGLAGPETDSKNAGYAMKAEAKIPVGNAKIGVMALYASGDKDFGDSTKNKSFSFITPMSIVGTTGYWGYTGKLNVQGPTDTGIDHHYVNIDGGGANNENLGNGITTVQLNAGFPVIPDKLLGYAALGLFTHNSSTSGFGRDIGSDIYAQGKYVLASGLNFDFGVDYAMLGKGHSDSVSSTAGHGRTVILLFSRLQLEY